MDYLGMNYKVRVNVEGLPIPLLPELSPLATFNPLNLQLDEVYTRGIYEMAKYFHQYLGVPILVTENNGQSVPRGDIETEIRNVVENLVWLARAVEEGVDVRGYFYWSLTDNYEWNRGMHVPLGLYRVDPEDPSRERVPRETVDILRSVTVEGRIPQELRECYPVEFEKEDRAPGE
jgi:beta-glucosidase